MKFKLDTTLDDYDLDKPDTSRILAALQANILKGHGRHHVALLFLEIEDVNRARKFLRNYKVTDSATQFRETKRFKETGEPGGVIQLAFISHAGLTRFGKDEAFKISDGTPLDESFEKGMVGDTEVLDRQNTDSWQAALKSQVDVLLLLAHDDQDDLARITFKHVEAIEKQASGFHLLLTQEGNAYFNKADKAIEHFGYVDGRSQPLMINSEIKDELKGQEKPFPNDPASNLDQFMFNDPLAPDQGLASLFVFRKLEQDVAGFKAREKALQKLLPGAVDPELAGAMVVGRFENGIPVTMNPEPSAEPVTNSFNYEEDDSGLRCPFQAHIRKTNPRGSSPGGPKFDKSVQMARRGITYGVRMQDPDSAEFVDKPNDGVGLLFMSYQASIDRQYHFMQVNWANDRHFPKLEAGAALVGIDPIIGQVHAVEAEDAATDHVWPSSLPNTPFDFQRFVHLKGGEYFYAPSPQGLKNL